MKLIERESATLTQKLETEKACLKKCPEAALRVGICVFTGPGHCESGQQPHPYNGTNSWSCPHRANPGAERHNLPPPWVEHSPSALFSDAIQLPPPARPKTARDGLNHVSPLSEVAPSYPNQVFLPPGAAPHAIHLPGNSKKRKPTNRSAPYQAPRENVPVFMFFLKCLMLCVISTTLTPQVNLLTVILVL